MTIVSQNNSNSHKRTSRKFIMRCQSSIFDIKPCSFPLEVSAFSIARCAPWTRSSVNLSPRNYKSIETYTCIGHTAFFSRYVNCIENFTTQTSKEDFINYFITIKGYIFLCQKLQQLDHLLILCLIAVKKTQRKLKTDINIIC